jgi:hypothetical protein
MLLKARNTVFEPPLFFGRISFRRTGEPAADPPDPGRAVLRPPEGLLRERPGRMKPEAPLPDWKPQAEMRMRQRREQPGKKPPSREAEKACFGPPCGCFCGKRFRSPPEPGDAPEAPRISFCQAFPGRRTGHPPRRRGCIGRESEATRPAHRTEDSIFQARAAPG